MTEPALRRAVVAGASGLVGRELSRLLLADRRYSSVVLLLRRPLPELTSPRLQQRLVSFDALPALEPCDDIYVALGTTMAVAGSQAAFRRVDHDYVIAVARAARAADASRLGLVSALGADTASRIFYNRVKGEAERDVCALGFTRVVIARPSLLLGERASLGQPHRAGETWSKRLLAPLSGVIPVAYRPVRASDVARCLINAVLADTSGVTTIESRDLHARR